MTCCQVVDHSPSTHSTMSAIRTLPPRVRGQPQRLAHEQEDEWLHADEAAILLRAMRLSIHPESGSETDTDSDSDSDEESDDEVGDVDEAALINSLDKETREKYDEKAEDEEKAGWTTYSPITVKPFDASPLTVPVLNGCTAPLQFFHALLPLTFFDHVTQRTNTWAEDRYGIGKENTPPSLSDSVPAAAEDEEGKLAWTPTTTEEILALVGCVVCMGMVKINRTADYWSKDLGLPFVSRTFPRNRFQQLLRAFHLADVLDPRAAPDRIHMVRHLNDLVIKQSQAAHYPSQHLTIDEAMVGTKGRTRLRQFLPKKKVSTGIKIWVLAECSTGYVYNFEVYQGKGKESETGQAKRVVNHLITPLQQHRWHIIGMDGFFSSVDMFDSLYQRGFYAVGTTRHTRAGFPTTLLFLNERLKAGQHLYRQRGDLVCVSWMDKKPVNLLSTYCDPLVSGSLQRWRATKQGGRKDKKVTLPCPEVVTEYHTWMRGVDVFSQRESYSRIGRRARRWWPRLAWFLIDMAINNAYILYGQYVARQEHKDTAAESPKAFRRALMQALVGTFTARKKRGRPWSQPKLPAGEVQHVPQLRSAPQECTVCSKTMRLSHGKHKPRTREGCETCGVAVHIACWKAHLPREEEEAEE
jgi:hypothetical protein